jgi:hypothetical protein
MTNTLIVQVDPNQLKRLKMAGFKLCLAKALHPSGNGGSDPNVIWTGVE